MVDNELTCSTMGLTSSVSGFLYLIESNQKLFQALGSHVASMHSQPSPIELGRFNGYNAADWVLQAELYFDFYAISDAHKLHYVSSYFDDDALEWFHWMYCNNQLVDWKYFKEQVVLRFQNKAITAPMGLLVDTSQAHFDYAKSTPMVLPVTQAEDSSFSSDNEVLVYTEGYPATTEAHLFDECSHQANHKLFVDDHSDATVFSPKSHSALEDENSKEGRDLQAEFEGSMGTVQETLVANDQEFVLEDFAPILENVHLNVPVSTVGTLSQWVSDSINHSSCLSTNFNTSALSYDTKRYNTLERSGEKLPIGLVPCCCHKRTYLCLHFELELILGILPFDSVVDAWVDTGQDSEDDLGGFEMSVEGSGNPKTAFAPYKLLGEFAKISFMYSFDGVLLVEFRLPDNLLVPWSDIQRQHTFWHTPVFAEIWPFPANWNFISTSQVKDQIGSFFHISFLTLQLTVGGFGSFLITNTSGNTTSFLVHFDDREFAFPKELEVRDNGPIFNLVVRSLSKLAMVTKFPTELANIAGLWMVLPCHTLEIVSLVFAYVYKLVPVFATGTQYLNLVRGQVYWNDSEHSGEAKNALTIVLFLLKYMDHIVNLCLDVFYITNDDFNSVQSCDILGYWILFICEVVFLPELLQHIHDLKQDAQPSVDSEVRRLFYFIDAYVSFWVPLLRLPTISCFRQKFDHSPLLGVTLSSHVWCEVLCSSLTSLLHLHLYGRKFVTALWSLFSCYDDKVVINLFTRFRSLVKLAEALGPLPIEELVFGIADLSIMAEQLQEVVSVIHIFMARYRVTYLTSELLNSLFSIWDGAHLYEMVEQRVKGANASLEDDFDGYLPCLESNSATESNTKVTTMVTVPFVVSYYHHITVSFLELKKYYIAMFSCKGMDPFGDYYAFCHSMVGFFGLSLATLFHVSGRETLAATSYYISVDLFLQTTNMIRYDLESIDVVPKCCCENFGMETIGGERATNTVFDPNLEDKVLFKGRRNVINLAMVGDPCVNMSNYIWDPGDIYIREENNLLGFML